MYKRVLLVEDNRTLAKAEAALLERAGFSVDIAYTYEDAAAKKGEEYCIALLDLNLPDAPNGEIVDLIVPKIPSVVFTATYDENVRNAVTDKGVIDYFIKSGIEDFKKVVKEVKRFEKNKEHTVLVVDDSRTIRTMTCAALTRFNFHTLEAVNGVEALRIIDENPDISLIITDYDMPEMDGFELIQNIRANHDKDSLAVIGLSASEMRSVSTRFIKYGANDFLHKPFEVNELMVRVSQNIELLEKIKQIKDIANRDYLTGLHNRRYFFEAGGTLYQNAQRNNITLTAAMIDLDHFKKINDTYGHHTGDRVIKEVAELLQHRFRGSDIVARMGGEEFCILAANMPDDRVRPIFESVCEAIEEMIVISDEGETVPVTASIGISMILGKDLDDMLSVADDMLYRSKENGRNQVSIY